MIPGFILPKRSTCAENLIAPPRRESFENLHDNLARRFLGKVSWRCFNPLTPRMENPMKVTWHENISEQIVANASKVVDGVANDGRKFCEFQPLRRWSSVDPVVEAREDHLLTTKIPFLVINVFWFWSSGQLGAETLQIKQALCRNAAFKTRRYEVDSIFNIPMRQPAPTKFAIKHSGTRSRARPNAMAVSCLGGQTKNVWPHG